MTRIPLPNVRYFYNVAVLVGACQLSITLKFLYSTLRELSRGASRHHPSVAVLVPCRDAAEDFRQNVKALLAQDYPGPVEFVFAAVSPDVPAAAALRSILSELRPPRARLVCPASAASSCSEMLVNMICAASEACASSEVLLFIDSDVRVRPDLVRELVSPLEDPAVGATTTSMLHVPPGPSPWGLAKLLWVGMSVAPLSAFPNPNGKCFALRRKDYDGLGIASLWGRTLADDLPLGEAVRRRGLGIRFVARAAGTTRWPATSGFFDVLVRWLVAIKLYAWPVWLGFGLRSLVFAHTALWTAFHPSRWGPLALLAGLDALNVFVVFGILARLLPDRFEGLHPAYRPLPVVAALTAPWLELVALGAFLRSVFARRLVWSGRAYRILGPYRIEPAR